MKNLDFHDVQRLSVNTTKRGNIILTTFAYTTLKKKEVCAKLHNSKETKTCDVTKGMETQGVISNVWDCLIDAFCCTQCVDNQSVGSLQTQG